jgi:hypothetical protein
MSKPQNIRDCKGLLKLMGRRDKMEFKLSNLETEVDKDYAMKLQKFGLKVERIKKDEKFWIVKRSQSKISFNSMEEFESFLKEFEEIIIRYGEIIIYDDYFE